MLSIKYWVGWDDFLSKSWKGGVKHEIFLMWNGVKSFWGKPFDFCHVIFLDQSLFHPCFWKNKEAAYFSLRTPPHPGRGVLLTRIFTNGKTLVILWYLIRIRCPFLSHSSISYKFQSCTLNQLLSQKPCLVLSVMFNSVMT